MNNFVEILLLKAEEDLKSAEILFKNSIYSNSFFMFEQSIEKQLKVYGIIKGIIISKEDELIRIGHKTQCLSFKIIKYILHNSLPNEVLEKVKLLERNKNYQEKLRKSKISKLYFKYLELHHLGFKEPKDIVKAMKNFLDKLSPIENTLDLVIKAMCTKNREDRKLLDNFSKKILSPDFIKDIAKMLKILIRIHFISRKKTTGFYESILPLLGLITSYPHSRLTRYPKDESELKYYTKNSEIVKNMGIFMYAAKISIKELKNIVYGNH